MRRFEEGFYLGPDLREGPLPTLLYFALSAEDSLATDPYNQPAVFLERFPMRIFSMDIPAHGPGLSPLTAMARWAEEITQGRDPITPFIQKVKYLVHQLKIQGALIEGKLAAAGLSRGAFIATHAAAVIPEIRCLLGFAPLTQITYAKEFGNLRDHPIAQALNLHHLVDKLTDRTVRFYIGNLDARVGTKRCFQFIELLANAAAEKKLRSPPMELFIKPSIGHHGHGTSKEVFHEGAAWVTGQLIE